MNDLVLIETKKLEKLKAKYLKTKHTYWTQEDWENKVNTILPEDYYKKHGVSLNKIYELEYCLLTPASKERWAENNTLAEVDRDEIMRKRREQASKNAKETLDWFSRVS